MPDTSSAYPPPPPAGAPPPGYQPAPSPLPDYQPPPIAQPPAGYPMQGMAPQAPLPQAPQAWQQPAGIGAGMGTVGILSQFSGSAAWACGIGLVTIVVPFVFNRVFFFLPIIGIISGIRAIQSGKLIGGIVGIVLSAIGGVVTLIGLFG